MEENGKGVKRAYAGDLDGRVIRNEPGFIAAVGEIPDEIKIFGGISFSHHCATIRYPETLTEDPIEREKIQLDAYKETLDKTLFNFKQAFDKAIGKAIDKALGVSSLSGQSDEEEAYSEDEEPHTLIHVNIDPDIYKYSRACKANGCSISTSEGAHGFLKMLRCDCGDYIGTLFYKGVIKNTPGIIVIAAGGVPDELKINGGVSVWFPCPFTKIHKNLLSNPALRRKAIYDAYMEAFGPDACLKNIKQAYKKARLSSDSLAEPSFAMIEINFVEGTDELNKDNMGIDTSTERAYRKALGISSESDDQLEEEEMEKAYNIDQKLHAITKIMNAAASEDILGLSTERPPGTSCKDVPGVPLVHVAEGGYVGNFVISNSVLAPVNINGFAEAAAKGSRLQRCAHYHPLVKVSGTVGNMVALNTHHVNIDVGAAAAAGGGALVVDESRTASDAQSVVCSATEGESDE